MSNESFEEWFNGEIKESIGCLGYDNRDAQTVIRHYSHRKEVMRETWNHQQKKIQELEKDNEELEKLLGEAVKMLNESHQIDSYLFGDGDYDIEIFLSKPEIQKYLPEGEV